MSDTKTERLEAVRTAIDAVIALLEGGEYVTSYSIGGRSWSGETSGSLLRTLRAEEKALEAEVAAESKTAGGRDVVRFRQPM